MLSDVVLGECIASEDSACEDLIGPSRQGRTNRFPTRQDEPYKDRQGHWKQLWPANKAHRQAL